MQWGGGSRLAIAWVRGAFWEECRTTAKWKKEVKPAPPEDITAQRVGTSKERNQSRRGELLRPTACE
jgi:hypothetical protein